MTLTTQITVEELTKLIEEKVEEAFSRRMSALLGDFDGPGFPPEEEDHRTMEEVYKSIDENMWTPPPGAKSSLELLREIRDSQ
ncbi:MAG: hypothetical protein BroJett018_27140 [Chloroflexota bacterium]|nr:MAG: hypothetical protein BroJett018_27140 [Chloroflexota bacterium]